ncbi:hypothetical protein P3L10_026774 [Capsicum annuum]
MGGESSQGYGLLTLGILTFLPSKSKTYIDRYCFGSVLMRRGLHITLEKVLKVIDLLSSLTIEVFKLHRVVLGRDEKEISIEQYNMGQSIGIIDRNNELQVIEPILERILDVETTLLRHNAFLNEVSVKAIFIDKQKMMTCMSNIAITHNIQFKVIKSSTIRYSLRCLDDNCVWRSHASKIPDFLLFQVTTYEKAHSCSINFITSDHKNATSKVICDYLLELVRDSINVITPNFVVDEMRRTYKIIKSYIKGWRAIQHAYMVIRGTAEENYNRLPSYLHMMKENNPETYTNIKKDNKNRGFNMHFLLMALQSLDGPIVDR